MLTCTQCGKPLQAPARGRRPRYCSRSCQARAYRARTAERAGTPLLRAAASAVRAGDAYADGRGAAPHARGETADHHEPPVGLSTDRIVRTAIRIADAEGLDALSMRRAAAELGAGTMSLYRYVSGKDALVELMVDAVFGESPYPATPPGDWRARLEAAARREWAMYSRHPWVLRIVATPRPPIGPNVMADVEWAMRAVDGHGLDPMTMQWVAMTVSAQVQGAALLLVNEIETERRTGVTTGQWRASKTPMLLEILGSGRFPMLSRLHAEQGGAFDIHEWFEFSLRHLLDGLAVVVDGVGGGPVRGTAAGPSRGAGAEPVRGLAP